MARHRGRFDYECDEPFELSRFRVESFIGCPACFWLDRMAGVKFPNMPPFNINSNTDRLLKRDFDRSLILSVAVSSWVIRPRDDRNGKVLPL